MKNQLRSPLRSYSIPVCFKTWEMDFSAISDFVTLNFENTVEQFLNFSHVDFDFYSSLEHNL